MQASTIFLKVSHSTTKFSLYSFIISRRSPLINTFLDASSLMLCLNLISKASFQNLIVSTVSSKQMFYFLLSFPSEILFPSSIIYVSIKLIITSISKMGNYYCCEELVESIPCRTQEKSALFRRKLKKNIKESQFKDTCLRVAERHYDDELELQSEEVLRQSIVSCSHYEANTLNHSINQDVQQSLQATQYSRLPSTLRIQPQNRQHYLIKLIKECYLFLDFSDCIDNLQSYDRMIRHQMMNGDASLDGSFIVNKKTITSNLESQLIKFNPQLIRKLQNYVKFCRKVKHDFSVDRKRFLSKLNLNLQSEIIQKYEKTSFHRKPQLLKDMFRDIQEIINVLMATVQTMYDLQLETGKSQLQADEFFNSANFYTMITSILFQSQEFSNFIVNTIRQCFIHHFKLYSSSQKSTKAAFINNFISLNIRIKENQIEVTKDSLKKITLFSKSSKIIQKIFKKSIPLFKLKLIYELNREIQNELKQLRQILSRDFKIQLNNILSRASEQLAIKWLLREKESIIDSIASNIIFTYQFVHKNNLMDKKGSCLTTFIEQVQDIIKWRCLS